jgi:Xaa-Pro aminopeptidase
MFSVDEDAYYMEDMVLVTERGHEILTRGLPYTAAEIESLMRR